MKKHWFLILVVIMVVAGLGFAGYHYWKLVPENKADLQEKKEKVFTSFSSLNQEIDPFITQVKSSYNTFAAAYDEAQKALAKKAKRKPALKAKDVKKAEPEEPTHIKLFKRFEAVEKDLLRYKEKRATILSLPEKTPEQKKFKDDALHGGYWISEVKSNAGYLYEAALALAGAIDPEKKSSALQEALNSFNLKLTGLKDAVMNYMGTPKIMGVSSKEFPGSIGFLSTPIPPETPKPAN